MPGGPKPLHIPYAVLFTAKMFAIVWVAVFVHVLRNTPVELSGIGNKQIAPILIQLEFTCLLTVEKYEIRAVFQVNAAFAPLYIMKAFYPVKDLNACVARTALVL